MKSIMLMASPPFHKIPIKGFYVSQGPTAYRYGDTMRKFYHNLQILSIDSSIKTSHFLSTQFYTDFT